jgi:hypothetical protein
MSTDHLLAIEKWSSINIFACRQRHPNFFECEVQWLLFADLCNAETNLRHRAEATAARCGTACAVRITIAR